MRYHVGGSLQIDDPTYVERRADIELCGSLKQGEFCYVLIADKRANRLFWSELNIASNRKAIAVPELT